MKSLFFITILFLSQNLSAAAYDIFVYRDATMTNLECSFEPEREDEKTLAEIEFNALSNGRIRQIKIWVYDRGDSPQVCNLLQKLYDEQIKIDFRRISYGFGSFIYDLKLPNGEIVFFSYSGHERQNGCLNYGTENPARKCEKY